jgi:hypothetical protein
MLRALGGRWVLKYQLDKPREHQESERHTMPARQRLCQQGTLGLLCQHTDENRPL